MSKIKEISNLDRGYVLAPEELPRMFALYRNPLRWEPGGDDDLTGAVGWGIELPDGRVLTALSPDEDGRYDTIRGRGTAHLETRWAELLDAELRWLAPPRDTRLHPGRR